MLIRNAVLLGLIAPAALLAGAVPLGLMLAGTLGVALVGQRGDKSTAKDGSGAREMASPFSLALALKYGLIFLALQVGGTLAQRSLGEAGFYAVSIAGGLVSSASAVASAGNLASTGTLSPSVAAIGALLASVTSALINLPIVARVAGDRALTRRVAVVLGTLVVLGAVGVAVQVLVPVTLRLRCRKSCGSTGDRASTPSGSPGEIFRRLKVHRRRPQRGGQPSFRHQRLAHPISQVITRALRQDPPAHQPRGGLMPPER